LNVFTFMLWTPRDASLRYVTMNFGGRIGNNATPELNPVFEGDEDLFASQMDALARRGLAEAVKLRALDDWAVAKRNLLSRAFEATFSQPWRSWHQLMVCLATGDSRAAGYFEEFSGHGPENNQDVARFVAEQSEVFGPLIGDIPAAQAQIAANIDQTRRWLAAEDHNGLDPDYRFQAPPPGTVPEEPIIDPFARQGIARILGRRKPRATRGVVIL
jgi:hypothetical protein